MMGSWSLRLTLILATVAVNALVIWSPVVAQDESSQPEQVLSHGFDCFSCHAIDQEVVGPAWSAIAEHYHRDSSKAAYLAGKIRGGSVGDFGPVPMPAHQDIDPKLATQLANYILSLKKPAHAAAPRKYRYKD